jgi:hypothetical protein
VTARIDSIEEVLIYHHKVKRDDGLYCLCGYQHRLGESIYRHTAEIIDWAVAE